MTKKIEERQNKGMNECQIKFTASNTHSFKNNRFWQRNYIGQKKIQIFVSIGRSFLIIDGRVDTRIFQTLERRNRYDMQIFLTL